jgi:hypothetical protein
MPANELEFQNPGLAKPRRLGSIRGMGKEISLLDNSQTRLTFWRMGRAGSSLAKDVELMANVWSYTSVLQNFVMMWCLTL